MRRITGIIFFVITLFVLNGCQQVPTYSAGDPTPKTTGTLSKNEPTNYKSPFVFTTQVDYYEPVFDY